MQKKLLKQGAAVTLNPAPVLTATAVIFVLIIFPP